jgi:hypothetical protein
VEPPEETQVGMPVPLVARLIEGHLVGQLSRSTLRVARVAEQPQWAVVVSGDYVVECEVRVRARTGTTSKEPRPPSLAVHIK